MLATFHKQQHNMPRLADGRKQKWAYFSLLFSVFYFVPLFFIPQLSTLALATSAILYSAFVALYLHTIKASSPISGILLLIGITTGSVFFNIGGYTLVGYILFIVSYYFETRKALLVAIVIWLIFSLVQLFWWQNAWFLYAQSILISLALFGYGFMQRKESLHEIAQQQSKDEIKQVSAIAERERIGRDLHDVAGHALSSISLKAQLAAKLIEKNQYAMAKEEVLALATLSQDLLSQVRKTVSGIKHLSFAEELEKLIAQLRLNDIHVIKNITPALLHDLHSTQETQLALICKEAITNILRHSNATKVKISFELDKKTLCLIIHDNGTDKTSVQHTGNGIFGMHERAALINGEILIDTQNGYKIQLRFERAFIATAR